MEKLGKPSMNFLKADEEYTEVFTTKSRNKTIKRLVDTLNAQGGDLRVKNDRIHFLGDSAGIDFADLELYKKTGYKTGFARIDFDFHNELNFSKFSCKLTK